MIEAVNLHKVFGSFQAVRDISLSINAGEVVALLGLNGAGKTTTVRMLGAILKPTTGHASVAGHDIVEQAREVRHVVGLLTEFPACMCACGRWSTCASLARSRAWARRSASSAAPPCSSNSACGRRAISGSIASRRA